MDASQTFRHQDYELLCSARAVDSGRFAPALVITQQVWPTRPREIAMQRGHHATPQLAINAAYAQGVEWVLHYGRSGRTPP